MKFGEVLRELIEENGITQKKLAEDLNIAPSTLGNYVRELREPDYETLKRIAAYFHVSIDFLLDYSFDEIEKTHSERRLEQIFSQLDEEKKDILIEQGKVLLRYSKR